MHAGNSIDTLPLPVLAAFWGLVAGSALLLGAAVGYFVDVPNRLIAAIMAFGSGVLISALSFELMDEAYRAGGFYSTASGFLAGALIYTIANWLLDKLGAKHRKPDYRDRFSGRIHAKQAGGVTMRGQEKQNR